MGGWILDFGFWNGVEYEKERGDQNANMYVGILVLPGGVGLEKELDKARDS